MVAGSDSRTHEDATRGVAKVGLTVPRVHLTWLLHHQGPQTQRALADALKVTPRGDVLTVAAVFQFIGTWNDFFGPLIYLDDPEKFTVALALARLVQRVGTEWNEVMAANLIVMIPVLVVYFFAQDKLIGGIANVGLKGYRTATPGGSDGSAALRPAGSRGGRVVRGRVPGTHATGRRAPGRLGSAAGTERGRVVRGRRSRRD